MVQLSANKKGDSSMYESDDRYRSGSEPDKGYSDADLHPSPYGDGGPASAQPDVLVRRDIWELENSQPDGWHPVTLGYAKAIAELQTRVPDDPTSWTYQAAIHGSNETPAQDGWNQCQHGGWYFLPWHRIYLYRFEQIIRSVVVADGGPEDWALPYWNYDASGSNAIPVPFRSPTMPDGSANPLFIAQRRAGINDGAGLPSTITSPATALSTTSFTPEMPDGFGGGITGFEHFFILRGQLEQTPHNDLHVVVGGPGGWMTDPNLAALDPIFWLHHANIDRLWSSWLHAGNTNPSEPEWASQTFSLFDAGGSSQTMTCGDVEDTVAQLNYRYDTDPSVPTPPPELIESAAMNPSGPEPELVGSSDRTLELTPGHNEIEVRLDPAARESLAEESAGPPKRIYLSVEHVDAEENPGRVYAVVVHSGGQSRHVGNISLFGVEEIRRGKADHEGHGDNRMVYDVTEAVGSLTDLGDMVKVSFEEIGLELPEAVETPQLEGVAGEPPIRIGRVAFFAR